MTAIAPPAVVALLRQTIGLNPHAIGVEAMARAVSQRMARCGVPDVQTYLAWLQTSAPEVQALIEEVVVPETWFFRDQMPFTYLGQYVMAEWLPTSQRAVLRVLSLACATGEKPYSIAMALLNTGLAAQHMRIEAVDISQRALVWAQHAVYGDQAFREKDLAFRERLLSSRTWRATGSMTASATSSPSSRAISWTSACWLARRHTRRSSAGIR